MPYRSKTKIIKFHLDEWDAVCERAEFLGKKTAPFIREMSVFGEMKKYDMKQFNNLLTSFNRIGCGLRQFLKVAENSNSPYLEEIKKMIKQYDELGRTFENYLLPLKEEVL